jgi:hypothetical protein
MIKNVSTKPNTNKESTPLWRKTGVKGVIAKSVEQYTQILAKIHMTYINTELDACICNRLFSGDFTKDDQTYMICISHVLLVSKVSDFIEFLKNKLTNRHTFKMYVNFFVVLASCIECFADTCQVLSKLTEFNTDYEDEGAIMRLPRKMAKKLVDYTPDKIVETLDDKRLTDIRFVYCFYIVLYCFFLMFIYKE